MIGATMGARRRIALPVLLVALAAAAGCSGEGEERAATTEAAASTTTENGPTATTTVSETAGTETEPAATETAPSGTERPATAVAITVAGGRPVGGIVRVTVDRGERVRLRVRSDLADEVHLHGYDVEWDVGPGRVKTVVVEAAVPGRFELELHETGTQIGELTVRP